MNTLKRKIDSGTNIDGTQSPATKKMKLDEENDYVVHITCKTDDTSGEYYPHQNDAEEILSACGKNFPSPRSLQQRPLRPSSCTILKEKQQLLDEQVSFIITTRDNNKPDPYNKQSETHGPTPWPAVADLYNAKFRIGQPAIGSAAMEKRARQHRDAWRAARPGYPHKIEYAKKVKAVKLKIPSEDKPQLVARAAEPVRRKESNAKEDVEVIDLRLAQEPTQSTLRVYGWVPPDDIRNEADIDSYIEDRTPVPDTEQSKWIMIDVENTNEKPLGNIHVRAKDICLSSKWVAQEFQYNTELRIKVICHSKVAVSRYVACVSPIQLTTLPEWEIVSLMDLYAVAAQMEDDWVRALVLERWEALFKQDFELQLNSEDLNNIFHSTEAEDRAREFWIKAVFAGGLAEQIINEEDCHATLKARLEEMVAAEESVSPPGN